MPRRKGGLFLPLDVGFTDDAKVIEAGERAAWLYVCMSLAAKRLGTDGVLNTAQIDRLHVGGWRPRLAKLIDCGLVYSLEDDHYTLAAWFKHNDPVEVVRDRRAKDAERKRGRSGVGSESVRTPSVEKSREERSTEAPPSGTALALRAAPSGVFAEVRGQLAARRAVSQ